MRHSNSGKKLGRTPSHRKALFRNMASAMITYGKIRTTEVKAKELRRVVEPLITLALRNDLHSRRLAYETLNDHKLVQRLFDVVAPLFAGVPGGFFEGAARAPGQRQRSRQRHSQGSTTPSPSSRHASAHHFVCLQHQFSL